MAHADGHQPTAGLGCNERAICNLYTELLGSHMIQAIQIRHRGLAMQAAAGLSTGEPITTAVKIATMKQLSCIMACACANGGFSTFDCQALGPGLAGSAAAHG